MTALELGGRKALVIGAGTASGRAIAIALAGAGADVAVASATIAGDEVMAARRTRRAIEALGRRTAEYAFDITLGQNVQVSSRQVAKEMGGLDILVNAQDAPLVKPAERTSDSEWSQTLALNLGGAFAACRAAVHEMGTAGGSILLIMQEPTVEVMRQGAAYVAAHFGLIGLGRALAVELRERQIWVNTVVVGAAGEAARTPPDSETRAPWTVAESRHLPAELGALAVRLAATSNQEITGQVLWVTGATPARG